MRTSVILSKKSDLVTLKCHLGSNFCLNMIYSASLKKGNPSLTQNISKLIKDVTILISVGDSIVILLSFDRLFIHL